MFLVFSFFDLSFNEQPNFDVSTSGLRKVFKNICGPNKKKRSSMAVLHERVISIANDHSFCRRCTTHVIALSRSANGLRGRVILHVI